VRLRTCSPPFPQGELAYSIHRGYMLHYCLSCLPAPLPAPLSAPPLLRLHSHFTIYSAYVTGLHTVSASTLAAKPEGTLAGFHTLMKRIDYFENFRRMHEECQTNVPLPLPTLYPPTYPSTRPLLSTFSPKSTYSSAYIANKYVSSLCSNLRCIWCLSRTN
jgi:hypothetical protein